MGRDSSVGIATRCGLDGMAIESRWGGGRFFARPHRPWDPPTLCTIGTGSFPGVKRPGRGADHPPPSSAEVKRESSYTSTPQGHRVCYGVPFTFYKNNYFLIVCHSLGCDHICYLTDELITFNNSIIRRDCVIPNTNRLFALFSYVMS
jgi:hypothetical protein